MNEQSLNITRLKSVLYAEDKKGRVINIRSRHAACFILTLKGEIRFCFDGFSVVTNGERGVFIPEGTAYRNECLADAESIVVNFETLQKDLSPMPLRAPDAATAMRFYHNVNGFASESGAASRYYLLSEVYLLAHRLFRRETPQSHKDALAEKANAYLNNFFATPGLRVGDVATHCNVSCVYLNKIFREKYQKTPFEALTDARMKRAAVMLCEGRQVKEVALSVGYSDVFQFSRAFKRYYGFPPSAKSE